jgi:hypothetical protein
MGQWLATLMAFALGAVGWFVAQFVGRPIREFVTLRSEIRRQVIFLGNVGGPPPPILSASDILTAADLGPAEFEEHVEIVAKAATQLRDLGSQAIAFDQSEWFASRVIRWFGIRPMQAGKGLIGLANSLENDAEAEEYRTIIEHALRFDRTDEFGWKGAPE